jgi:hypothetical protein
MAGSYNHCRGRGGKFTFDTIENMRDAYQACEEMYAISRHFEITHPEEFARFMEEQSYPNPKPSNDAAVLAALQVVFQGEFNAQRLERFREAVLLIVGDNED